MASTKLQLICGVCGRKGTYQVGTVYVDPESVKDHGGTEDSISFSRYFRCRECKSAWPWEFTTDAWLAVTALMMVKVAEAEKGRGEADDRLAFVRPVLFDGTVSRSAAQAEEHLLGILERDPENAFVWDRLGNIYFKNGMTAQATRVFKRAAELDPDFAEAHFSLGLIFSEKKNSYKRAEEHLHKAMLLARKDKRLSEDKRRDLVRAALEKLVDMSREAHGEISPFPKGVPLSDGPAPELPEDTAIVYLTEFDLSQERGWERLIDTILGQRPDVKQAVGQIVNRYRQVGRNDPCPCGSGRKFKKCCGG